MLPELNRDRGLIFRITHRNNLPWILANGLYCGKSKMIDPHFVSIGNPELIEKRKVKSMEPPYGGSLAEYIPFYFTPLSPMFYNIYTGYGGIARRQNRDIVILVSSLPHLTKNNLPYIFSDRHAYLTAARFSSDLDDLEWIDWEILQRRDFRRDVDDLEKVERYEAEALVYKHLPLAGLLGLACCTDDVRAWLIARQEEVGTSLKVIVKREWYFG